jgi:DNA repair protein RadC
MKLKKRADGPREKLVGKGPEALSDVEVIAGVIGTGTANNSAMVIARNLLDLAENSLGRLAQLTIRDLMKVHGIGHAKAVYLKVALELYRRAQFEPVPKDFRVVTSKDAFRVLGPCLGALNHEEFWAIYLNRRSRIIYKTMVSKGGLTSTIADPRVIFRIALDMNASSLVIAHNHPSGDVDPSQADLDITRKLSEGAKIFDLQLVDHLIISGNNYCSFADSGLL